jgi:hypothetical protein
MSEKNYRLITGPDDDAFCLRVSEARREGWELYGSASMAFNGAQIVLGQAVIRPLEPRSDQS